MTSGQLAEELGLSLRTIQRYIASGAITPELRTLGGHTRWDPEKVRSQLRTGSDNQDSRTARPD
ncbi:helix-turn-helix domain-containing protein [Pseudonocardia bannensis]|uniref:Helix-turn-helix domain-containing protein n=1 Tax=Pseudonocardia bannensis TaxID=630973 RepID=A0A848DGD4_9PSEU|nr:helix-turn-helix domain-containing protein [Pseudonocardia bannensis]